MKSLYGELVQIDIAKCVNEIVDAMLPRFTEDKVLSINIIMEVENFKTAHCIRRSFDIIYYRPSNYTFVGTRIPIEGEVKTLMFPDRIESELKQHSYHDSCWRSDGTEHIIRKFANEIVSECNGSEKNYSVYTTFGLSPIRLISGKVEFGNNPKFIPLKK